MTFVWLIVFFENKIILQIIPGLRKVHFLGSATLWFLRAQQENWG